MCSFFSFNLSAYCVLFFKPVTNLPPLFETMAQPYVVSRYAVNPECCRFKKKIFKRLKTPNHCLIANESAPITLFLIFSHMGTNGHFIRYTC